MKSWLAAVVLYALVNPNLLPAREATPAKMLSQLPAYVDRLTATQIREYKSAQRLSGTQPSHALADYTGTYSHPAYGELEGLQRDEGLFVRFHGQELMLAADPIRMLKREPGQFTSAEYLGRFAGVYSSENNDITIYVQSQTLFASMAGGGQVIELAPEKENIFCFKLQPMMKVEF